MPRIAIGAFSIECNSFAPGATHLDDFKNQVFVAGISVNRDSAGSATEFAGAWDVFATTDFEIVPTLVATSTPRAPITHDAFMAIATQMLDLIPADVDAVYLALHGSSYCPEEEDPEGALLEMVRDKIGPDKLIAISLDLHAYYTQRMLSLVDIATAYRTSPHIDLVETGARAAALLVRALKGEIQPKTYLATAPMITSAERHTNNEGPFMELIELCRQAEERGALTASLLATQPWIDVSEHGWKAIVTMDSENVLGQQLADSIMEQAWLRRKEFLVSSALPSDQALSQALALDGPCVIADLGDATNGGSRGDSTHLLRTALVSKDSGSFILSITDPIAAKLAYDAGVGSEISLSLGTGGVGTFNETVKVDCKVVKIANKKITYTNPATGGAIDDPGHAALVEITNGTLIISVVIHTNPVRVIDPVIYELFDLEAGNFSVMQAKSPNGFKAGFARVTKAYRLANTPGPTTVDLASLDFKKRPRPLFPFEDF